MRALITVGWGSPGAGTDYGWLGFPGCGQAVRLNAAHSLARLATLPAAVFEEGMLLALLQVNTNHRRGERIYP